MASTDERPKGHQLNIARTIRTWRRVRETRIGLNRLSQRCLDDFGILRSDIPAVARRLAR